MLLLCQMLGQITGLGALQNEVVQLLATVPLADLAAQLPLET